MCDVLLWVEAVRSGVTICRTKKDFFAFIDKMVLFLNREVSFSPVDTGSSDGASKEAVFRG